jgi:hypothetical protein
MDRAAVQAEQMAQFSGTVVMMMGVEAVWEAAGVVPGAMVKVEEERDGGEGRGGVGW